MPKAKKQQAVTYAITPSAGRWHGFVQTGLDGAGDPIRTHRTVSFCKACKVAPSRDCAARCYQRCEDKVRAVEQAVTAGKPVEKQNNNPGAVQALTEYLDLCQERVDAGTMAYHTLRDYRMILMSRVVPRVRDIRIRQLDRDRIRAILREVQRTISASAARKTLTALRIALGWALREGYVDRNEAELVTMPTLGEAKAKIEPLSEDEFAAVVPVIWSREQRRARWLMALIHGERQTELLGLALRRADQPRWPSDVDLKRGTVTIREKIERRFWEHGCDDPHACGANPRPHPTQEGVFLPPLHKTRPCPRPCTVHTRACPPPCAPNCVEHARGCPQRKGGGLVRADTKTEATKQTVVLDPVVVEAFRLDLADRDAWAARAGSKWVDSGAVFVTPLGGEVDPRRDWDDWQAILTEAGLPHTRVHDLRHTAATNMLAAGLDKRTVTKLMGWSQDMTHVYVHVVESIQRASTAQLGSWLRATGILPEAPTPAPEPPAADTATVPLPADLGNVIPFRRKAV